MRKMRRKLAVLLVFVLAFTMMPQNVLAAKKKVKLSKKSVTITVGKTVKVKLKNNKKKVKWTVVSGKKNVKLSKKKKTSVTIKGKKVGKAKVQVKVGKKKFVCKVTVKNKKRASFFEFFEVMNREYLVVTFLAILEMVRKHEINITQENNFDDIICEVA